MKGQKRQMDMIQFNKEETIVFEGHYLPDVPLADHLTQHHFTQATITQVVRELDMTKKPPVSFKGETYGIYGYSDYATAETSHMNTGRNKLANKANIKRLILKTDNNKTNDLTVNLRRNMLKKCQNIRIRTDIQAEGLYFVKTWLLKLIP